MTFDQLRTDLMDRLNLSSTEASTRVGRAINRTYRKVTSAIGMQLSRRGTVQENVTMGVSTVVFSDVEKIINVVNRAVSPYRTLDLVTIEELRRDMAYAANDNPTKYAIHSHTSDSVTIEINRVPQTAFALYADAHQVVSDLSGSNEPAFPESFHDVIIEGVLADEYRKLEKAQLAAMAKSEFDKLLSDLKMWIAKENALDVYQGKNSVPLARSGGSGSSSGSSFNGAQSWTQTGNINFDRGSGVAPFTIDDSDAAKVANLDADKLDGEDGSAYHNAANLTGTIAAISGVNVTNLNASALASGTVPVARLGAGTFSVTTSTTTGATNNWAPTLSGNTLIKWNGASDAAFTGLDGGVVGQIVTVKNVTAAKIATFAYDSGSSDVDNQFQNLVTSTVTPIGPGGWISYQHDGTDWKLIGHDSSLITFTPTFTGLTVGNGTVVGAYRLQGNTVWFRAVLSLGGTSSVGASLYVVFPLVALNSFNSAAAVRGIVNDSSTSGFFPAEAVPNTTASAQLCAVATAGTYASMAGMDTNIPMTWAVGDILSISGIYEVS